MVLCSTGKGHQRIESLTEVSRTRTDRVLPSRPAGRSGGPRPLGALAQILVFAATGAVWRIVVGEDLLESRGTTPVCLPR